MKTINLSTIQRLEEIVKANMGYEARTGNDLKERAKRNAYKVFQTFKDGNVEVIVDIEKHQPWESITLPFCAWHDEMYGRSGGGRNLTRPGELHAIYVSQADITHYFMVKKSK